MRPQPRRLPREGQKKPEARSIPAGHPNHVWWIGMTRVLCWGLRPIQVLVAMDHFSRQVVCVAPLEEPNAGWIIEARLRAVGKHGSIAVLFGEYWWRRLPLQSGPMAA